MGRWEINRLNERWVVAINPTTNQIRRWLFEASDENMEFVVMAHEMWPTLIRTIVDQRQYIEKLEKRHETV